MRTLSSKKRDARPSRSSRLQFRADEFSNFPLTYDTRSVPLYLFSSNNLPPRPYFVTRARNARMNLLHRETYVHAHAIYARALQGRTATNCRSSFPSCPSV